MDSMKFTKSTKVEFWWGDEQLVGVVDRSGGGWVMVEPENFRGVFAVREGQVWLPGEEAPERTKAAQTSAALPSEAAESEVTAT